MPRTVLVVDDDPGVRDLVAAVFHAEGFSVECSATATTALHALDARMVDLVVLDLTLPDVDGLAVLAEIRQRSPVPVIVLTGRGTEPDRLLGFEIGADDYLAKPFSPRELLARAHSVLRRVAGPSPPGTAPRLEFGALVVDTGRRQVLLDGVEVDLARREFDLLAFLATHTDRVWSRDELLEQVWQSSDAWQGTSTVTEHVRRLRLKLEADPEHPRWLRTERGVGYRFHP